MDKYERLRALLKDFGSCLVAYSGGGDCVLLADVAREVREEKSLAVIADSPSLPRRELEVALAIGRQFHFPVRVVRTHEFDNPAYLSRSEEHTSELKSHSFISYAVFCLLKKLRLNTETILFSVFDRTLPFTSKTTS